MIKKLAAWIFRTRAQLHEKTNQVWRLEDNVESLTERLKEAEERYRRDMEKAKDQAERYMWLRAQCMNLRVAQAERPRVGWEVMAYIPQEVVDRMKVMSLSERVQFTRHVADVLVAQALNGIHHVNSQGKVNALVFAPLDLNQPVKASDLCQVLFDKDGKYKMSDRLPRLPSESERIKRIC